MRRITIIRSKKPFEWRIFIALIFIFIFMKYFVSSGTINATASLFHQTAIKEQIELQVVITSAWPKLKDYWNNCHATIDFEEPRLSRSQWICINNTQWIYFRDHIPVPVTIYGNKSEYGYELFCCR